MKLADYLKTTDAKEFASGGGLPEGKTVIRTDKTESEQITGIDGKPRWRLTQGDTSFIVPKSVMERLQKEQAKGFATIEIVRQGKELKDTKYTVLGV